MFRRFFFALHEAILSVFITSNIKNRMKIYYGTTIKDWSVEDRPREKLLQTGTQSLSNSELIAIILGSGTKDLNAVQLARNLMISVDNNLHALGKLGIDDLTKLKGIGTAKAISLLAALELGTRRTNAYAGTRVSIKDSQSAFDLLYPILGELEHEEFWIVILNRAHKVLKKQKISQGGLTGTVIDTRIILKYALDQKATSLIISHNHPSGNTKPSEADLSITRKIGDAARLMDIQLLDHIIIAGKSYLSLSDEGLMG